MLCWICFGFLSLSGPWFHWRRSDTNLWDQVWIHFSNLCVHVNAEVVSAIYPCTRFSNFGRNPGSTQIAWDFRLDGAEYDYWPCHIPAVWIRIYHLILVILYYPICKMWLIIPSSKERYYDVHEGHSLTCNTK